MGAENLGPPGFDPLTVQPLASRYTDYTIKNVGVEAWESELSMWTTTTTPSTGEAMFPIRFHYTAKTGI
jgi:hypothetical protein